MTYWFVLFISVFFDAPGRATVDSNALRVNLSNCFGRNMEDVEINGTRIFENMSEHQQHRVETVLGGTARNYNKDIIETAKMFAQDMGYQNLDDFLCVVELVACEVKGRIIKYEIIDSFSHLPT